MSYSDLYRNAMEKAATRDSWKTETLNKMAEIQATSQKNNRLKQICFSSLKQAFIPLTSAAVIALILFCNPIDLSASSMLTETTSPQAAAFSAEEPLAKNRSIVRAMPSDTESVPEILPELVYTNAPNNALPTNTCPIDFSVVSQEQYEQAIQLLETQLVTQAENGVLSVVFTTSDIVAEGYLDSNDSPQLVFVFPATSITEQAYYVYQIPIT